MKKIIIAVLSAALILTSLTACGGKFAKSEYTGTWRAEIAWMNEAEQYAVEALGGEFMLYLYPSGKAVVDKLDKKEEGTWEETKLGVKIDLKEDMELTVDSEKMLTYEYGTVPIKFEKKSGKIKK